MTRFWESLQEGWTFQPYSFVLLAVALVLLVGGTALATLGVIAVVVGNDRIGQPMATLAAFWILPPGLVLLIVGLVGWKWPLVVLAPLALFAWYAKRSAR